MENRCLINFVPSTSTAIEPNQILSSKQSSNAEGDEIRSFYEDLVHTDFHDSSQASDTTRSCESVKTEIHKTKGKGKHKKRTEKKIAHRETVDRKIKHDKYESNEEIDHKAECVSSNKADSGSGIEPVQDLHRLHYDLLNFSQNGNLAGLQKLMKCKQVDINFQDQYGWTALMCAAVARHIDVVKVLVENGANKYIENNNRQTVLQMCGDVFEEIQDMEKRKRKLRRKKVIKYHCETCETEFTEISQKEHNASTVHLFNMGLKPKSDKFMINESNVGFQLMQKSGWDGESGLGTKGQGQKYPVKTSLKRDRKCLGTEERKKKSRVTHFGPNDTEAVKSIRKCSERIMSASTISKRERKRKIQIDKKWERDLRTYMNID